MKMVDEVLKVVPRDSEELPTQPASVAHLASLDIADHRGQLEHK